MNKLSLQHDCLHTWFESQAALSPSSKAIVCSDQSRTYQELNEQANRLAHHLISIGVRLDDVIGLALPRDINLVPSLIGILKSGAAYAPIDPNYPSDRIEFVLSDCNASAVVTTSEIAKRLGLQAKRMVLIDQLDLASDGSQSNNQNPSVDVSSSQMAYLIYTSGSTGKPKGVMVTHANATRLFSSTEHWFQFGATDTWTLFHSFAFDFSVWEIWGALLYGGKLVVVPYEVSRSPQEFYRLLCEQKVTVLNQTPSAFRQLIRANEQLHGTFSHNLRVVVFGGEALEFHSLKPWVDRYGDQAPRLINMYGITETTVHVTYRPVTADEVKGESSSLIGEPIPDLQLHVLDENLAPAKVGTVGEIYVSGAGVAKGYLNRPELTAERFISNPLKTGSDSDTGKWYKTGDLGCFRADGELEYHGRSDRQVQLRGFRVELGEIESRLLSHSAFSEVIVAIRTDDNQEQTLVAYLITTSNTEMPSVSELRAFVNETLPDYMIPQFFVPIDEIPLTDNGKLNVNALPLPQLKIPVGDIVPPETETEKKIAKVWCDLLKVDQVSVTGTFFEWGGQSLMLPSMEIQLNELFPNQFAVVDLFQYPTIESLAKHLDSRASDGHGGEQRTTVQSDALLKINPNEPIAIIGMSGRFPGADNVDEFWENLKGGVESIRRLSEKELLAANVPLEKIRDPKYVPVTASLDGVEMFDAEFFGVSPREANITDPQHRLFLECAWSAFEHAGYDPAQTDRRIGVFAGARPNSYRELVHRSLDELDPSTSFQTLITNEKDFLSTRVSFRMDLIGPSMTIQTGCSTSLVAIQLACQALQTGQCNMALSGGVSVNLEYRNGYLSEEGMILSPDGHVRTFDENARGTVFSEGVAAVVLKRLSDAQADGDTIHAVIKGVALNNDGGAKTSYSGPSIDGQSEVIAMAQRMSQVSADSIGYIEAHGTGTYVGDPVEMAAISQAFRQQTDRKQYCAIGSIKTNIGHQDVAAGVVGLIKTALTVRDGVIPPSLHFETPNRSIDFESSPFFVAKSLQDWPANEDASQPRRAGVSSFGIGGTNAHAILEQAPTGPAAEDSNPADDGIGLPKLLPISARTPAALEAMAGNLAEHLERHSEQDFADVIHTLQNGRRAFGCRQAIVARDAAEAIERLGNPSSEFSITNDGEAIPRGGFQPTFMFPGQGAQYVGMTRDLYDSIASYRTDIDYCCHAASKLLNVDLREVIFADVSDAARERLTETWLAQPAIFITEFALARLWMRMGVQPSAVVGHSIGEYAAACIAGVFSVETALELTIQRGRLLFDLPRGSMLAVSQAADQVRPQLPDGLVIAVINSPQACVVSGETERVQKFAAQLESAGVSQRMLQTSHAFHSPMTEPILDDFASIVAKHELREPKLPILSTVTGTWVESGQMSKSQYWVDNIRQPVLFSDAAALLVQQTNTKLLEVGPGQTLGTLARMQPEMEQKVVRSTRHPKESTNDVDQLMKSYGELWTSGVQIEWQRPEQGRSEQARSPKRVPLPTYPFQRKRYWYDDSVPGALSTEQSNPKSPAAKMSNLLNAEIAAALPQEHQPFSDWFYVPAWNPSSIDSTNESSIALNATEQIWLVFIHEDPASHELVTRLRAAGREVIAIQPSDDFEKVSSDHYRIRPESAEDFDQVFGELSKSKRLPERIVHLWQWTDENAIDVEKSAWPDQLRKRQSLGLYSLQLMSQSLGRVRVRKPIKLALVSAFLYPVGDNRVNPSGATLLGAAKVIPLEYPQLQCRLLDIPFDSGMDHLLSELCFTGEQPWVAYRAGQRFLPDVTQTPLDESCENLNRLKVGGTYLVTGGLGGIGHAIARFLSKTVQAKLILISRSQLPPRDQWDKWLQQHPEDDATTIKIQRMRELESAGGEVLQLAADSGDREQMQSAVKAAVAKYGSIDGVVHSAGVADTAGAIQLRDREMTEQMLKSKVTGSLVLEEALRGQTLDFWISFSSISNALYHNRYGQLSYVAGNSFLESFAAKLRSQGTFAVAIAWDEWQDVGMAAEVARDFADSFGFQQQLFDPLDSFSPADGERMFHRILSSDASTVMVSTRDLKLRIELDVYAKSPFLEAAQQSTPTDADGTGTDAPLEGNVSTGEQRIARMWEKLLSIKNVGPDDNYFALGGDSLTAVKFLIQAEKEFGERFPFATIVEFPTPRRLADYLQVEETVEQTPAAIQPAVSAVPSRNGSHAAAGKQGSKVGRPPRSTVVQMSPDGDLPPLFCCHAADGYTLIFNEFVKRLDPRFPVYGIQSPALFGEPIESIEALASRYVQDIQRVRPEGPYLLTGYCMGGTIAYEIGRQLIAAGHEVQALVCIETYNWHTSKAASKSKLVGLWYYWQKVDFHLRNFLLLNFSKKRQFLRDKFKVLWRRKSVWLSKFSGKQPAGDNDDHTMSLAEIWERHDEVAELYLPPEFPGKICMIRAKKDYARYRDSDLPAAGGIELHRLQVYPAGMMADPFVDDLVAQVEKHLRESIEAAPKK